MGIYTDKLCTNPRTPLPAALRAILRLGVLSNYRLLAAPSLHGNKAKFDLWLCVRLGGLGGLEATTMLSDDTVRWTLQEWEQQLLDLVAHDGRINTQPFKIPRKHQILAVCSPEWINDKDYTTRLFVHWTLEHTGYWGQQSENLRAFQKISGTGLHCNAAPLGRNAPADWTTNG